MQRAAGALLSLVLLTMAGVSVGASTLSERTRTEAAHAAEVSDLYQQAQLALTVMESASRADARVDPATS